MLNLVFSFTAKAIRRVNFVVLKVWLAVAMLLMGSYAAAAQICFDPTTQQMPGVNVTTTGKCNRLPSDEDPTLIANGFWLKQGSAIGNSESCALSFSPAVKNLTVDVGVHTCMDWTCEVASFEINGAHRSITAPELLTPTQYSDIASAPDPSTAISIDSVTGDLKGTVDLTNNGNGSGKISFSESAVSSIKITNTTFENDLGLDNTDPGGSWFNVCYDGLVEPTLKVIKVSQGGTGEFTFNGTAANANGFSTNSSYKITTDTSGVAKVGSSVQLSAANVVTEIQEIVPTGWVLTSASCIDASAASTGNPPNSFGVLVGNNTLRIPASTVRSGADLQCTFNNTFAGLALSGKVILDNGAGVGGGAGTAHDGIQNGAERGHSGVPVSLTNCSGTVYSSTTTSGDGSFILSLNGVPPGPVCVVETLLTGYSAVSVNVGDTAGTYNASATTLQFTLAANTSYSGVVLGEAPLSTLTNDGAQQAVAGQPVTYAHTYTAGSTGTVTFTASNNVMPAGLIWTSVLYRDTNCNGVLDDLDTLVTAPVPVTVGAPPVCILVRVFSPAGAISGAKDITTLTATESWSVPTLSPTSQTHTLTNTDTTTVASGGLTLLKEVRRVTTCPATAAASIADPTAYGSYGTARPGDVLEYRLRYSNNTSAPMSSIKVFDTVQAFTVYKGALCLTLPNRGIASCAVSQQPAIGATSGSITWTMTDATAAPVGLQPLDAGSLSFCLQLQQ